MPFSVLEINVSSDQGGLKRCKKGEAGLHQEYEREVQILRNNGIKTNPLRMEYETKVRELQNLQKILLREEHSMEYIAQILHRERRRLGEIYKEAAPPLFREYIFYATEKKYGDPLGPRYEVLRKQKTPQQIMESAVRPIPDLNDRLTIEGFCWWFHNVFQKNK